MDGLHPRTAADHLARLAAGAVEQHGHGAADTGVVEGGLLRLEQLLERLEPPGLDILPAPDRRPSTPACRAERCI